MKQTKNKKNPRFAAKNFIQSYKLFYVYELASVTCTSLLHVDFLSLGTLYLFVTKAEG